MRINAIAFGIKNIHISKKIIGSYGSDAVASYGIAYKINMIPILLSVGLSQGVAPLVGYCYGGNNKLFSGIRKSDKIINHYTFKKCGAIYSRGNYSELFLEVEWCDCNTASGRDNINSNLHIYVYQRYKMNQPLTLLRLKIVFFVINKFKKMY